MILCPNGKTIKKKFLNLLLYAFTDIFIYEKKCKRVTLKKNNKTKKEHKQTTRIQTATIVNNLFYILLFQIKLVRDALTKP